MKAGAPEKIYFPFENEDDVEALELYSEKCSDKEIEYTRTDAFIEKACSGIEKLLSGYIIRNFNFGDYYDIDRLIEDFKNYIKK